MCISINSLNMSTNGTNGSIQPITMCESRTHTIKIIKIPISAPAILKLMFFFVVVSFLPLSAAVIWIFHTIQKCSSFTYMLGGSGRYVWLKFDPIHCTFASKRECFFFTHFCELFFFFNVVDIFNCLLFSENYCALLVCEFFPNDVTYKIRQHNENDFETKHNLFDAQASGLRTIKWSGVPSCQRVICLSLISSKPSHVWRFPLIDKCVWRESNVNYKIGWFGEQQPWSYVRTTRNRTKSVTHFQFVPFW